MRLDDFDPNINVGEERDQGSGFGGFGGFGGGGGGGNLIFGLLPLIGSRFGCGGIVVVVLLLAVFGGLGNLGQMVGGGGGPVVTQPATREASNSGAGSAATICREDQAKHAACNAFSSAQKTWAAIFQEEGKQFDAPGLRFYDRDGTSGCGAAQRAMGPFYCPRDSDIYLDPEFFDELVTKFGVKGDFAQDYVVAHEFGHHIQNLLGVSDQVSRQQAQSSETDANKISVRLELQADCYAGVWANRNKDRLDPGDVQEGLTAAHAIGDDTLEQQAQGQVVPDSFTHGTSAQRMHWLKVGIDTGDPARCDTFSGAI